MLAKILVTILHYYQRCRRPFHHASKETEKKNEVGFLSGIDRAEVKPVRYYYHMTGDGTYDLKIRAYVM